MPGEELGHFGLDRLRQEIASATAQDFGELILAGGFSVSGFDGSSRSSGLVTARSRLVATCV
jgi:hypothetical protein